MTWYILVLLFMALLGVFTLAYQIFKLTEVDAKSRGLKYPKFWGLFSLSGNNGSGGLILYLIGRRKYPSTLTDEEKGIINTRKKRACVSLCFIAFGAIGLIISISTSLPRGF